METIGIFAQRFGLSRSTLLYYDRIGLLKPSVRAESGYRRYGSEEGARMEKICSYRQAGLGLEEIQSILNSESENELTQALERRFEELVSEIEKLRQQQGFIVQVLKRDDLLTRIKVVSKKSWTQLLRDSGFSDDDMNRWHAEFEQHDPDRHEKFLRLLSIPEEEIKTIRAGLA